MKCPICKKDAERSNPEFPFCSERCRTIDLGNWASGRYVVSTPLSSAGSTKAATSEQDED